MLGRDLSVSFRGFHILEFLGRDRRREPCIGLNLYVRTRLAPDEVRGRYRLFAESKSSRKITLPKKNMRSVIERPGDVYVAGSCNIRENAIGVRARQWVRHFLG